MDEPTGHDVELDDEHPGPIMEAVRAELPAHVEPQAPAPDAPRDTVADQLERAAADNERRRAEIERRRQAEPYWIDAGGFSVL